MATGLIARRELAHERELRVKAQAEIGGLRSTSSARRPRPARVHRRTRASTVPGYSLWPTSGRRRSKINFSCAPFRQAANR
jgi:hypothetical protein